MWNYRLLWIWDILAIVALSLIALLAVFLGGGLLRIAAGLLFVLLCPGYALMAALFPRKSDLGGFERLALSVALSVAMVALVGLALNYTPWGIRTVPLASSLLTLVLALAALAAWRRYRLLPEERFQVDPRPALSRLAPAWRGQGWWEKVLTVVMVVAIGASLTALVYMVLTPRVGERFTEFYILGLRGKADAYPGGLLVGQGATAVVGIVNQEQQSREYRVEVAIGGESVASAGPVFLRQGEKWERVVTFAPRRPGSQQKVEFWLYEGNALRPYRSLRFWIDVSEVPR